MDAETTAARLIRCLFASFVDERSPIIIVWWYPDPTLDRDFVKVSLPVATRECLENRPEAPDRCDASREVLLGKEVGSCGYNTHSFEK